MLNSRLLLTVLLATSFSAAFVAGIAEGKHLAGEESRIEIENEKVLVRRNIHPPHSVTPMHSHRAGIVVYLTDVDERSTDPTGISKRVIHRAGDVVWAAARTHRLENLADTSIETLEMEIK